MGAVIAIVTTLILSATNIMGKLETDTGLLPSRAEEVRVEIADTSLNVPEMEYAPCDDIIDGYDIARTAVECACTASPEGRIKVSSPHDRLVNDLTLTYVTKHDEEWDKLYRPGYRSYYASCAPAVLAVVRASGGDPYMDSLASGNQGAYFRAHSDLWEEMHFPSDAIIDEVCQPGDIINRPGHTMLYVGNDLVRERFPESDGNMYEAAETARLYPGITTSGNGRIGSWWVFRLRPRRQVTMDDGTIIDEVLGTIQ